MSARIWTERKRSAQQQVADEADRKGKTRMERGKRLRTVRPIHSFRITTDVSERSNYPPLALYEEASVWETPQCLASGPL
jgi:hypothetical protein